MKNINHSPGFRIKATMVLGFSCLVILSPFAINNFIQGRILLGIGSTVIVLLVGYNAWLIRIGKYSDLLTLVGIIPALIFFLAMAITNPDLGILGALWAYPVILSTYIMLGERKAWIANIMLMVVIFPLAWDQFNTELAIRLIATMVAVSIFSVIFIRAITEQQEKLELQSITDSLTGLLNRSLLKNTLEESVSQFNRASIPMTLVAIDVDHFKSINDSLGHDAGDVVLRDLGKILQKRFRRNDKVFRLGGEEFLVVLQDTDKDNAQKLAEELRQQISEHEFLPDSNDKFNVTVSMGIATLMPSESWKVWMKRADDNLYTAKVTGRNQVAA